VAELVIPNGFVNIHFLFSVTGDAQPMSFAIGAQFVPGDFNPQAISDEAYIAFSGGYAAANWYDQWTFLGTRVEVAAGAIAETMIPLAGTGGTLGTVVQNTSVLVKKITGVAGRAHRGRAYFPPISLAEVDVNNVGMIDSTVVATIQSNWDGFISALDSAADLTFLALLHASADDPDEINSWQVEGQVATQRRRLR
jgi:hypothetical protein